MARMEDILDLYAEAHDPYYPVVCFDEHPMQLIDHTCQPLPSRPGTPARYDYHYQRMGTCNLFISFAPRLGWRHIQVSQRRTITDFAQQMKWLVDEAFPDALKVRVVLDNLNTHTLTSLYKTFAPHEARRIARKLEFHFTPVHGSWLNMAEIELAVLGKQCLNRRIPYLSQLSREVAFWEAERNANQHTVQWLFTCEKARQKLARLYPS